MSDCTVPMRTYSAPTHSPAEDELRVSIRFTDGTSYPMVLNRLGREVLCIDVDGERFVRQDPDEQWELEDGRITAVILGGVRYEKVSD